MKILTTIVVLLPFSLYAETVSGVKKLTEFLDSPSISAKDCEAETKSPTIKKGEVKIAYDCSAFPVPNKGTEAEAITFYTDPKGETEGLTIRSRASLKDSSKHDVTVKFRPKDPLQGLVFDKDQYKKLKNKSDDGKGMELKCEADVSYGPVFVNSCSVTTDGTDLTDDHQAFAQMTSGKRLKSSLSYYTASKILAQSWKIPSDMFPKGISVERWDMTNSDNKKLCLLEVSAKFEVKDPPEDSVELAANAALKKLKEAFPDKAPLSEQGNKTGKAMKFLNPPLKHK